MQRLKAWIALTTIMIGVVVTLVGLYLMILYVSALGLLLILISLLIMHSIGKSNKQYLSEEQILQKFSR
jgi:hypothetical protein